MIKKKRDASALQSYFWEAGGRGEGRIQASETTAELFSLGMVDNSSQQDKGWIRGLILLAFEYTRRTLADIFGHPWAYQYHTKRLPEQVLAQYRGWWLLEDAVLKGRRCLLFQSFKGRKRWHESCCMWIDWVRAGEDVCYWGLGPRDRSISVVITCMAYRQLSCCKLTEHK